MAVSIRELSKRCGLSVSTVSKALNNYADVSCETRETVRRMAEECGYMPNAIARALKMRRTYNLGILFVDDNNSGLTHNYFSAVLESFKREAERRGYDITFINHNIGASRMTYRAHCEYRRVDGLCLACINFDLPEVRELAQAAFPVVTIDHIYEGCPCIQSDNQTGMYGLTRYAQGQGHKRIAYIRGADSAVAGSRLAGFCQAMAEAGLPVEEDYLPVCAFTDPDMARRQTERLLGLAQPPTCILVCDDYAALGAMEAVQQAGLTVPGDISLAGYDGIRLTQLTRPRLTTVRQDTERIGRYAASALIDRIEHSETIRKIN